MPPIIPNRSLEPVQILCIVEHIACLVLEGVAGYVDRTRLTRCRQEAKGEQEAMEKNKIIDKRSNDRLGIVCPKPPAKADFISWTNGD